MHRRDAILKRSRPRNLIPEFLRHNLPTERKFESTMSESTIAALFGHTRTPNLRIRT